MEYETYEDVIDSYNLDNQGYMTLTDYIKGNNIKIKEIEMDPIGDMEKILREGKAPMEKEGVMQLASGNMDIRIEEVVKEFIKKRKRRPRSLDEIKEFYMEEMMSTGGPTNKDNVTLARYEPGKYSDDDIEMYENYKYDMNEQRPGMPIMEIDDFLRMEYGQAKVDLARGGLAGILGA